MCHILWLTLDSTYAAEGYNFNFTFKRSLDAIRIFSCFDHQTDHCTCLYCTRGVWVLQFNAVWNG